MALEFTWLLVVNLIGCFVLLAALFLGQTQIVEASSFLGLALNFFGGFILFVGACYGVFVMKNVELVPSIILNVVWTLLSAIISFTNGCIGENLTARDHLRYR